RWFESWDRLRSLHLPRLQFEDHDMCSFLEAVWEIASFECSRFVLDDVVPGLYDSCFPLNRQTPYSR
ncbi:hypothetical protein HN51_051567, partial [Arachis hypogaea]